MKIRKIFVSALTAAVILSCSFPVFAAQVNQLPEKTITVSGNKIESDAENGSKENTLTETAVKLIPSEAPPFHAHIEFRMGYTVIGTFTDFTPDIALIQTLYSLDGENWQISFRGDWNLFRLNTDDEDKLKALQNQPCLFSGDEALKSYIAGQIDCFYVKLRITTNDGLSYETQPAVIERGGLQPIPEGTECRAMFASSISVREPDPSAPYRYRKYGRYQFTVCADSTAEEISALLPDTLPVEVQLDKGPDFMAIGIVDCPVTWKPLSLPRLSAGESITIADAAEEILVPAGTEITTPLGIFQLEEPLSLDTLPSTDEVRLVLNVSTEDRNPSGVLREGTDGLEIAFQYKPTGAVSIQAYVLAEGESAWKKLSALPLTENLDQPSMANSGYALVLRNDQEPYRSYLAAADAGETPTPFFIGLTIEGGIYDGRQLVLAWPDIYEQLPELPKVGGAEGNEGNAGADNKEDSTENGQRPNLPQTQDDKQEGQTSAGTPDDSHKGQQTPDATDDSRKGQQTPDATDGSHSEQQTSDATDGSHSRQQTSDAIDGSSNGQQTSDATDNGHNMQQTATAPNDSHSNQQPVSVPDGSRNAQQTAIVPNDSEPIQQQTLADTPETASATPKSENTPAAEEPVSNQPSDEQTDQLASGQRPNLPQKLSDMPDTETAIEYTSKTDSRLPLLPVTAAAAASGCIGMAVCKMTKYSPFRRIATKIRNISDTSGQ